MTEHRTELLERMAAQAVEPDEAPIDPPLTGDQIKGREITLPAFDPPLFRGEALATMLNVSLGTFRRWAKSLDFAVRRAGRGRGFVWYYWDDVMSKLHEAGFTNLPDDWVGGGHG